MERSVASTPGAAATTLWRFNTGSAVLAAPAVGPAGTVYVGAGDGSIQAINPNGVLRFSYMVDGVVEWAPVVDPSGRVYVATSAQRLYSFLPAGGLGWLVRTPVHVATDPVEAPPWGILFGGEDSSVWAYSARGAALWHVVLGSSIVAGPVQGAGGHTMVATALGDVWLLEGAVKRAVAHFTGVVRSIGGVFADGSGVVVVGRTLYQLDPKGEVSWHRDGIDWASVDRDGTLAIDAQKTLVRLDAAGSEQSRTPLGVVASDAPVRAPSGEVLVPTVSGELAIVTHGVVRTVWPSVLRRCDARRSTRIGIA